MNTDLYASQTGQITEFKRKPRETIAEFATIIQVLYDKIEESSPELSSGKSNRMISLFSKGSPEGLLGHVSEEKNFSKAVLSTKYLERHKETKLRNKDFELETSFNFEVKIRPIF